LKAHREADHEQDGEDAPAIAHASFPFKLPRHLGPPGAACQLPGRFVLGRFDRISRTLASPSGSHRLAVAHATDNQ
jgi:hypothetical protein